MHSPDWWTICKRFGAIPLLIAVAILFIAFNAGVWKWLGEATNATAIEGFAAIVQGVFALTLIVLTAFTVQANLDMARETRRMAEAAVAQQRGAIRPAVVLRLHKRSGYSRSSIPDVKGCDVEVANVGAGPALETVIGIVSPLNYSTHSEFVQPITLAQMESVVFGFDLDVDVPFLDPSEPTRWPRTKEDRELEEQMNADRMTGRDRSKDPTIMSAHLAVRDKYRKRQIRYQKDLTSRIAAMVDIGYVQSTYRDLAHTQYTSSAFLLIGDRGEIEEFEDEEEDLKKGIYLPTWSPITLGPLSIQEQSPIATK